MRDHRDATGKERAGAQKTWSGHRGKCLVCSRAVRNEVDLTGVSTCPWHWTWRWHRDPVSGDATSAGLPVHLFPASEEAELLTSSHLGDSIPFPGASGQPSEKEIFSLLQLTWSSRCHLHPRNSVRFQARLANDPRRSHLLCSPERTSRQQPLGSPRLRCSEGLACRFKLFGGCADILSKSNVFFDGTSNKEPASQCGRRKRCRLNPWVGKIPCRREWQPTPVFLPGKSQGQRSLVGYGITKSDTTEHTQQIYYLDPLSHLLRIPVYVM